MSEETKENELMQKVQDVTQVIIDKFIDILEEEVQKNFVQEHQITMYMTVITNLSTTMLGFASNALGMPIRELAKNFAATIERSIDMREKDEELRSKASH